MLISTTTTTELWQHHHQQQDKDGSALDIQPHFAVLASVLMLIALYLLSIAFRYFIYTIAVAGFYIGSIVTWVLLTAAEPDKGYPSAPVVYLCSCFGAGILVAVILMFYWRIGLYLLAVVAGYILSIFIFSWRPDHILLNVYARQFTGLGFAIAGILAMYLIEFVTVITSISFLGSYSFIIALDLLIHTGFINGPRSMLDANPHHHVQYQLSTRIYAMLGGVLGLWLAGAVWHLWFNRGRRFGLDLVKTECHC